MARDHAIQEVGQSGSAASAECGRAGGIIPGGGGGAGELGAGSSAMMPYRRALVTSSETTSRASGNMSVRPQVHRTAAVKSRADLAEAGAGHSGSAAMLAAAGWYRAGAALRAGENPEARFATMLPSWLPAASWPFVPVMQDHLHGPYARAHARASYRVRSPL